MDINTKNKLFAYLDETLVNGKNNVSQINASNVISAVAEITLEESFELYQEYKNSPRSSKILLEE